MTGRGNGRDERPRSGSGIRVGLGLLLAEALLGECWEKGKGKTKAVRRRRERAIGENKKGA